MSREWKHCRLGDVIELKRGYDLPKKERQPGSVPLVSSSGVSDTHSVAKVKGPGVVTGRYGTIGTVYYVEDDFWPLNTTLYVRDFKGNDPRFVSYLLRGIDFHAYSDKAAVPGLNRNDLHQANVLFPPMPEQRAIAATLGALDDKIELNRKMNATLEAMARALFRDWFVDFGPTRAKMEARAPYLSPDIWALFPDRLDDEGKPEGWEVSPLGELGKVEWGNTSLTKSIYVEEGYPAFSAAGQDGFVTTPERKGLGVVISAIGTVGKIYLASGSWTAIKNTLTVQGETDAVSAFVYYLLQETALPTRGSTQQFISLGDAKAVKVISPNHQFILAFFDLVEPLIRKAIANANESRTLAQTRDLLVPRLMSGELRVADLDGQKAEHA